MLKLVLLVAVLSTIVVSNSIVQLCNPSFNYPADTSQMESNFNNCTNSTCAIPRVGTIRLDLSKLKIPDFEWDLMFNTTLRHMGRNFHPFRIALEWHYKNDEYFVSMAARFYVPRTTFTEGIVQWNLKDDQQNFFLCLEAPVRFS
ncbi:hypothetical protein quinque_011924 [Culex quinquefasciatus]